MKDWPRTEEYGDLLLVAHFLAKDEGHESDTHTHGSWRGQIDADYISEIVLIYMTVEGQNIDSLMTMAIVHLTAYTCHPSTSYHVLMVGFARAKLGAYCTKPVL